MLDAIQTIDAVIGIGMFLWFTRNVVVPPRLAGLLVIVSAVAAYYWPR